MSVTDVIEWFYDLPLEAKLYWTGNEFLDERDLPWQRYHEYTRLRNSSWFTYAEMVAIKPKLTYEEYSHTNDFSVFLFHERDRLHRKYEEAMLQREEDIGVGWGRSPAYVKESPDQ